MNNDNINDNSNIHMITKLMLAMANRKIQINK